MKRSKMLRKIKSIIATCGPTQPTIVTAEQVLRACENAGMKPPGVWVNEHIYDRTSGMHGWEKFEWEAETGPGHYKLAPQDFDALEAEINSDKGPSEQVLKAAQKYKELNQKPSKCIDCGVETKPGPGSARCPACWEDKLGESV